jgi:hypothetical protein
MRKSPLRVELLVVLLASALGGVVALATSSPRRLVADIPPFVPPPSVARPAPPVAPPPPPPLTASIPEAPAARLRIPIRTAGSAIAADLAVVSEEVRRVPATYLERLATYGAAVVVCRGSVTEYATELKGVTPRAWPAYLTYDVVPAVHRSDEREVVIATTGHPLSPRIPDWGEGHSSFNLTLHELAHALDVATERDVAPHRRLSADARFDAARAEDRKRGSQDPYLQSYLDIREEQFAELFARYYGRDPALPGDWPSLYSYAQKTLPPPLPAPRRR